jgi:hypothetical protein
MKPKTLVALFIAALMISSTLGFILSTSHSGGGPTERVEVNGVSFVQTHQGWLGYLSETDPILVSSDPRNFQQLPELSLNDLNSANRIYFTFNPEDNLQHTFQFFDLNIRPRLRTLTIACTEDVEGCEELPLINCSSALDTTKVIQVSSANETSVTYENNCLHIQGNQFQLPELFDATIVELMT